MTNQDLFAGLNRSQLEAVQSKEGPLLVLAGAGTGKTKTLTARIAHLVHSGAPPQQILAITFTNKAAQEMKQRVKQLLDQEPASRFPVTDPENSPFVGTFHILGLQVIRENHSAFQRPRRFSIMDRQDSQKAVKQALQRAGQDPKSWDPGKLQNLISRQKGDGITPEQIPPGSSGDPFQSILPTVWSEYEKILEEERAFDFDDLLLKPLLFLESNPEILAQYQNRWKWVHIDEYQDTNNVQYRLAGLISAAHHNLCAVGDPDQTIYTWRGAQIGNILRFETDYPNARVVFLEENYRSTGAILQAANSLIRKNTQRMEKELFTRNSSGRKPHLISCMDEQEEAEYLAEQVQQLINRGVPVTEIAILYRTNFQSRILEEVFLGRQIPYLVTGTKFFERKEVKEVLAYLQLSEGSGGSAELKRVINQPPRGLGKTSVLRILEDQSEKLTAPAQRGYSEFLRVLDKIKQAAADHPPSEVISTIIKESGLEDHYRKNKEEERIENIHELVTLAGRYDEQDNGLEAFLDHVALFSQQDELDNKQPGVRLLTVHAAKGLEFDHVFVSGLEEGLFPHTDPLSDLNKQEEERRLFYVAMTRAKKELTLSYAQCRTIFGNREYKRASKFLQEMDPETVEGDTGNPEPLYRVELL